MKQLSNKKRIITLALIVAFISVQIFLPIQIAQAQTAPDPMKECGIGALTDLVSGTVSGLIDKGLTALGKGIDTFLPGVGSFLFGGEDPVKDEEARANTRIISVKGCIQSLKDMAFKVALAKLKKRLLDRITDDTIEWINNGAKGRPRFVENFGDTLRESTNEALGDTAREIGLGKLCDEKLSLKLQINLKKPETKQFRQQASCTLDKIVDNVNAFNQDFRNGGWVGYTESLSPNNNRFGLEILAFDQVYGSQMEKKEEAQLAASSNGGFKGVEACAYWEIIFEKGSDTFSRMVNVYTLSGSNFDAARDPNANFTDIQLKTLFGALDPTATPVLANCERKEITMPAQTVKGQTDQALQSDKDVVANADDLSPYISAIFDAAINRLVKNGLEGIGIKQGGSSGPSILTDSGMGPQKRPPQTYGTSTRDQNYTAYGQDYQNATDMKAKLRADITANIAETKTQISQLETSLPGFVESIRSVKEKMDYLLQCEIQKSDNIFTMPVTGTVTHLMCASTDAKAKALKNMYDGVIEFQNTVTTIKAQINTVQDLSNLSETQLITIGSQISSNLDKIKTTRSNFPNLISELEKIDEKIDAKKTQCLAASPTYICPATF